MTTKEFILNHYNKYNGKFDYVENPYDYIDEIVKIGDEKVAFVNCSDWFKQYELAEYDLEDEIETDNGFYCPYSLLEDVLFYVNKYQEDRYEVYVLDNSCCTFVDTVFSYDEVCKYITDPTYVP